MAKPVRLTWNEPDVGRMVREVWLVSDDDLVYMTEDGQNITTRPTGESIDKTIEELAEGHVLFEDDDGIFRVQPLWVIKIEHLE